MYLQIEEEFKEQSEYRNSQILFIFASVIFSIGLYYACDPLYQKINDNRDIDLLDVLYPLLAIVLFLGLCYLYIFSRCKKYFDLPFKDIFKIIQITNKYQEFMHIEDIKTLRNILKEYNINTRPKIQEAIRHYQCLLPRKIISGGQLLTILALVISIIALLFSEPFARSESNIEIFFVIILMVIIGYLIVQFIAKNVLKIFSNEALYIRMEASLAEIFMNYYLRKSEEQEPEEN